MPERNSNVDKYRFGFNGMGKDDEIKGLGISYTTTYRMYDSRLGRWLSIDPLVDNFSWQSPYVGMDNNPIALSDPYGNCTDCPKEAEAKNKATKEGKTPDQDLFEDISNKDYTYNKDLNAWFPILPMENTLDKVVNAGKDLVEGFVDPLTFTLTSLTSDIGNTVKGLNKKIDRTGFISALDAGGIDVLSKNERFNPIGFSFENEGLFKKESSNFSETLPWKDGKRVMKGTLTIISSLVPTIGLIEGGIKMAVGAGLKKGIDAIPNEDTNKQPDKSKQMPKN